MARDVAASIPPSTVQPMVERATLAAPVASASGNTPRIKASEVISIGRRRRLTASRVALITGIPLSTRSFANSTIRMAFFAERPINVIKPICAYTLFTDLGIKVNVSMAPNIPSGTASKTEKGTYQLSYNAARNKNTNTIDNAKIKIVLLPAFTSSRLNPANSYP